MLIIIIVLVFISCLDTDVFQIIVKQQGKLAKELDFVSHHIRTKLDELKRQEVNRLRTLIKAKQDLEGGNGTLGN